MKLAAALGKINERQSDREPLWTCGLATGFTPLHLQTFLHACLLERTVDHISLEVGLFGDLPGNIQRFDAERHDKQVVVVEWSDLDPRLGHRTTHGWRQQHFEDIVSTTMARLNQLQSTISNARPQTRFVVSLPTLPFPPMSHQPPSRGSDFEFQLRGAVSSFAGALAALPNVRVLSPQHLDANSPPSQRYDLRSDLSSGFPYHKPHAYALAKQISEVLLPSSPMKGIITDLDNTFWRGILGEDGLDGVHWNLDHRSAAHGLYQELLQTLHESGTLIAVASKNDSSLVEQAFQRQDLVFNVKNFFPIEAHWEAKSKSVSRILNAWNIGEDSVTFVDDSPMELAEVKAAFPNIDCQLFPTKDDRAILELLWSLREKFGKDSISKEDRLRAESLKASATRILESADIDEDEFLARSDANVEIRFGDTDKRTLELINKTNQFNINGRRYDEAKWQACFEGESFLLSVNYSDKFGPLGKIAVAAGTRGDKPSIETMVLSCRAFSRRVEFQMLRAIFDHLDCDEIQFNFEPTERNGPARSFLSAITGDDVTGPVTVTRTSFEQHSPHTFGTCAVI